MRKPFIDNARNTIILLVVLYHVAYLFNGVGVISNVSVHGILAVDVIEYLLYPWFMCCLFMIGGISARYALEGKKDGEFLKSRAVRLLVPSIVGIFITGWFSGWVTSLYNDFFMGRGEQIPAAARYLVYCFAGIGPLWFAHQLFAASVVLVLLRKADKKEKLLSLGANATMPVICAMYLLALVCAQLFNMPVVEVYHNGLYICFFLLGYYVFSHEHVQEMLGRYAVWLLAAAVVCEAAFTIRHFGGNYAALDVVKSPLSVLCSWFGTLAALGCFKAWGDRETKVTRYLNQRGFAVYVLHYPLLIAGFMVIRGLELPMWSVYLILTLWEMILLPVAYEAVRRIPVLRFLLLGIRGKKLKQK